MTAPPAGTPPSTQQPGVVPARRTSGAAVASLVFGLLGVLGGWCLCGLPSLFAIVFGHVGMARTRSGTMVGHGVAVAGVILGYVFIGPTAAGGVFLASRTAAGRDILQGLGDFFSGLVA